MDIEHLSKSQIILLTLFVSFITSIATGIITFSLMQQAPPVITQTVNRIVERTVEKAVPGHTALVAAPISKTVIVKQTDATVSAVAAATPSVVRLYTNANGAGDSRFLGLGVVLTTSGLIATDASILDEGDAVVELGSGARARAFVDKRDANSGVAFLSATTSPLERVPAWKPFDIAATQAVLGQYVIALAGKSALHLGAGIIAGLDSAGGDSGLSIIGTNIAEISIMPGSPLIDDNGTLVGISTSVSRSFGGSGFVSAQALLPKETTPKER